MVRVCAHCRLERPKPAYVFDGRNLLDHNRMSAIGFSVEAIGKVHDAK
jgi:hypothetical protein